jgi:hypothetical protein
MAVFAGSRIRDNNVFGTTTDNPLTNVATTLNSAGLANLSAVSSNHAVLVLDPLRAAGAPEIVIVTAHTGAATSATVTRGAYGSSARQHASGTLWVLAATVDDLIRICTSATRPADVYEGELIYETDTDSYKAHNGTAWEHGWTLGAWTSFTPTLTQSGAVTKTVTRAKYTKVGRLVTVSYDLACTGAGTAANRIDIGVPLTAAYANDNIIGAGYVFDLSANLVYAGAATQVTTTTFAIYLGSGAVANRLGVAGMTAALAAGDTITATVQYEAAA